jgi:hypothetical protein
VYNADQLRFGHKVWGKWTLSHIGEKHTLLAAQSAGSLMHSYTIVPTLCVCIQEPKGLFAPHDIQSLFTPRNLVIGASPSGRMGKLHLNRFF